MSLTQGEISAVLRTASYEELAAALFAGKLAEIVRAGADFGIQPQQLLMLLLAILDTHNRLTDEPAGAPN